MNKTPSENIYRTTDLYLSATLKTLGFTFIKFESSERNRGRGTFFFEDRDDREKIVSDFFSGKLSINIRDFLFQWKSLKNLTFQP